MKTTKDDIKTWLNTIEQDREWLGQKLHVTKRTIDNWLSSKAPIPKLKLKRIEEIMAIETQAFSILQQPLYLHPTKEQFNDWNAAWRDSHHPTLEDWAIAGLDELAENWQQTQSLRSIAADAGDGENRPSQGNVTYPHPKKMGNG